MFVFPQQFAFDESGVGCELRGKVSVTLGMWHSYKQANLLLWKAGAFDFWIGLHLDLFPNQNIYPTRKLFKSVVWFNLLRLSYPMWKADLDTMIGNTKDSDILCNHMLNLRAFMEFFIPAVQDYGIALKLNDGKRIMTCMVRLLKVFMCLQKGNRQSEYITVITAQLMIFADWISKDTATPGHPMLKQFLDNPSVMNEEGGEIALSVMFRGMAAVGKTADRASYEKEFRLIHERMAAARDLKLDIVDDGLDNRDAQRCKQMTDDKVDAEVEAVTAHFKLILREMKNKSWRPTKGRSWDLLKRTKEVPVLNRVSTARRSVPLVKRLFQVTTNDLIKSALKKTVAQLDNHDWVATEGHTGWGVPLDAKAEDKRRPHQHGVGGGNMGGGGGGRGGDGGDGDEDGDGGGGGAGQHAAGARNSKKQQRRNRPLLNVAGGRDDDDDDDHDEEDDAAEGSDEHKGGQAGMDDDDDDEDDNSRVHDVPIQPMPVKGSRKVPKKRWGFR
jgi:hypothetical protein